MLALGTAMAARAMPIDTGNGDLAVNFDNTFKYSAAWRVKSADPALTGNANADDGDRNFGKGLISNRVDWLSEVDAAMMIWPSSLGESANANVLLRMSMRESVPGYRCTLHPRSMR